MWKTVLDVRRWWILSKLPSCIHMYKIIRGYWQFWEKKEKKDKPTDWSNTKYFCACQEKNCLYSLYHNTPKYRRAGAKKIKAGFWLWNSSSQQNNLNSAVGQQMGGRSEGNPGGNLSVGCDQREFPAPVSFFQSFANVKEQGVAFPLGSQPAPERRIDYH